MKYELGDRVVAVSSNMYGDVQPGETGTVIEINFGLSIKWDTFHSSRHDCYLPDICPDGYGTFVGESDVSLLVEDNELDGPVTQKMIEEVL